MWRRSRERHDPPTGGRSRRQIVPVSCQQPFARTLDQGLFSNPPVELSTRVAVTWEDFTFSAHLAECRIWENVVPIPLDVHPDFGVTQQRSKHGRPYARY